MNTLNQSEQKVLAAQTAVETLVTEKKIHSGMKIGLGTGSTAIPAVKRIARFIDDGILANIKAVTTSFQTSNLCQNLGIPVYSMNDRVIGGHLELAIDGADEIDPHNNLIKGGGGALLLEKIIAYNSDQFIIVADATKDVSDMGCRFPLPVEIIGEARISIADSLKALGAECILREAVKKCGPVITDNGNQILDCKWKTPVNPEEMEFCIKKIPGVVETGFFTQNRPNVFIARTDGSVSFRQGRNK